MVKHQFLLICLSLVLSFCACSPLPMFRSDLLVANVIDEEKDAAFAVSSLYGTIPQNSGKVVYEPNHSYNGGANFKLPAQSSGNSVFIPFKQTYIKDPHCVVDFEGFVGFHTINPQKNGLHINLYDVKGDSRSWKFEEAKFVTAMCWGPIAQPKSAKVKVVVKSTTRS